MKGVSLEYFRTIKKIIKSIVKPFVILIFIFFILMFAGIVITSIGSQTEPARKATTQTLLSMIDSALEMFRADFGAIPSGNFDDMIRILTDEKACKTWLLMKGDIGRLNRFEESWHGPYLKEKYLNKICDGYGNKLIYKKLGDGYCLVSPGKDGALGTEDDVYSQGSIQERKVEGEEGYSPVSVQEKEQKRKVGEEKVAKPETYKEHVLDEVRRKLKGDASIKIESKEIQKTTNDAIILIKELEGYIIEQTLEIDEDSQKYALISFKIPTSNFDTAIEKINSLGKVKLLKVYRRKTEETLGLNKKLEEKKREYTNHLNTIKEVEKQIKSIEEEYEKKYPSAKRQKIVAYIVEGGRKIDKDVYETQDGFPRHIIGYVLEDGSTHEVTGETYSLIEYTRRIFNAKSNLLFLNERTPSILREIKNIQDEIERVKKAELFSSIILTIVEPLPFLKQGFIATIINAFLTPTRIIIYVIAFLLPIVIFAVIIGWIVFAVKRKYFKVPTE